MPSEPPRDRRRSTRVRLKVEIEAKGVAEPLNCKGETEVVNLHGAFISTAIALRVGMTVDIRVVLTGKCARATVVYVDREQPRFCGVSFERSQNIWGICCRRTTGQRVIWRVFPTSANPANGLPCRYPIRCRHSRWIRSRNWPVILCQPVVRHSLKARPMSSRTKSGYRTRTHAPVRHCRDQLPRKAEDRQSLMTTFRALG